VTQLDIATIDGDTAVLARFWAAALSLVQLENEDDGRWILLGSSHGARVLGLQRGASRAGGIHLDLACEPAVFDDEVARLVALGAALTRPVRREHYGCIANLRDPEGNLFDLCAYGD
jgi:predicted enzyme related to lactoylglutathione lyase